MTLTLPVNAEALLVTFLKAQAEVAAICSTRVYTVLPDGPTFPAVRVDRIGGYAVTNIPLHLEAVTLQVNCWAGPKATAYNLAQTCRAAIAERIIDAHDLGVVTKAEFGNLSFVPDTSRDPAQNRYVVDVTLFTHP